MTAASDHVLESLKRLALSDRAGHAYLFVSEGSAGRNAAEGFAKALTDHAADILFVAHEKPNLISVDDIRSGVTNTASIKPYGTKHKVYIIDEAEKMNAQAQNALLKTLEEPPAYMVLLLVSSNPDAFLPTILSRVVRLNLSGNDEGPKETPEKAEDHAAIRTALRDCLSRAESMTTADIARCVSAVLKYKDDVPWAVECVRTCFRDVLAYKLKPSTRVLRNPEDAVIVRPLADRMRYENIEKVLETAERTLAGLRANVNPELSFEMLLFSVKEGL